MNNINLKVFDTNIATWNILFAVFFFMLFILIILYSLKIPQGGRKWWIYLSLLGILVITALFLKNIWWCFALVEVAALLSVAMVWEKGTFQAKKAAKLYLILLVISIIFLIAGLILIRENE